MCISTHRTLRFHIGKHVEENEQWANLKHSLESSTDHIPIIARARYYCKLESNRKLPLLERMEGGLGNIDCKQLRPRHYKPSSYIWDIGEDLDIVFNAFNSKVEVWTLGELDDLIQAFVKTFEIAMKQRHIVTGCVEISE